MKNREISWIVVHCTAGPQTQTKDSIKNYWKNVLKWKNVGYHFLINADGSYERLASDETVTNGVAGYNSNSIHISYKGGVTKDGKSVDNRTEAQKKTLLTLIRTMKSRYPKAIVQGHRDFPKVAKDCPCFNAKKEYNNL